MWTVDRIAVGTPIHRNRIIGRIHAQPVGGRAIVATAAAKTAAAHAGIVSPAPIPGVVPWAVPRILPRVVPGVIPWIIPCAHHIRVRAKAAVHHPRIIIPETHVHAIVPAKRIAVAEVGIKPWRVAATAVSEITEAVCVASAVRTFVAR